MQPVYILSQASNQPVNPVFQNKNEQELIDSIDNIQSELESLMGTYISRLASLQPQNDVWVKSVDGKQLGFVRNKMDRRYSLAIRDEIGEESPLSDLPLCEMRAHFLYFRELKMAVIRESRDFFYEIKETLRFLREHGLDLVGDDADVSFE